MQKGVCPEPSNERKLTCFFRKETGLWDLYSTSKMPLDSKPEATKGRKSTVIQRATKRHRNCLQQGNMTVRLDGLRYKHKREIKASHKKWVLIGGCDMQDTLSITVLQRKGAEGERKEERREIATEKGWGLREGN